MVYNISRTYLQNGNHHTNFMQEPGALRKVGDDLKENMLLQPPIGNLTANVNQTLENLTATVNQTFAAAVLQQNQFTEKYGLSLSEEDTRVLVQERVITLREQRRVEFGEGILPKLIFVFCDSPFIEQDTYVETLQKLQEIFYLYKNESMDELTDDELLEYMKDSFDGSCQGSLEYLADTCLEDFARRIRKAGRAFFGASRLHEEDSQSEPQGRYGEEDE